MFAWVTVDGKPLEVFGSSIQNGKAVGHIEATEGAQFEVFAADLRTSIDAPHVRRLYLDGQRCACIRSSMGRAVDTSRTGSTEP